MTTNRRAFLKAAPVAAAALAVPGLAAQTPSASTAEWDALMARYLTAEADYQAFYDAHYKPHLDRWKQDRSYQTPEHIDEMLEHLAERGSDLEGELICMPAPHRSALRWKLDKILRGGVGGSTPCWSAEYVAQTIADYRRLLGEA